MSKYNYKSAVLFVLLLVLINNVNCGLLIDPEYIQKSRKTSTLTINYNNITNNSYNSMWALSYLLIWDTHLSDIDLKSVSSSLNTFISKGETVSFLNTSDLHLPRKSET